MAPLYSQAMSSSSLSEEVGITTIAVKGSEMIMNLLLYILGGGGGGERKASRRNWGVRTPYCLHSCTSYCISELFISHSPGGMSAWYLYELFGLRIFIQLLIGMSQKCSHQYNNKQNILNLKKSI